MMTSHRFNDFIGRIFSGESMAFTSIGRSTIRRHKKATDPIHRYFNKRQIPVSCGHSDINLLLLFLDPRQEFPSEGKK